jgi:RNA polymerase sigma-70 factor, ECF subfamily
METTFPAIEIRQTVEALYRADGDRLWRAVFAFAGDAEVASDAVAEAYAQVLARGDAVRDVAAWTWRTAFRISAGALKARRAEAQRVRSTSDDDAVEAIDGRYDDQHVDTDLLAALAELPPSQRAAVVLFYYADLPVRAIADRLGTNQLAVRANLTRGRRRLRELLGDRDV